MLSLEQLFSRVPGGQEEAILVLLTSPQCNRLPLAFLPLQVQVGVLCGPPSPAQPGPTAQQHSGFAPLPMQCCPCPFGKYCFPGLTYVACHNVGIVKGAS